MGKLLCMILFVALYVLVKRMRRKGEDAMGQGQKAVEPPAFWLSYAKKEASFSMLDGMETLDEACNTPLTALHKPANWEQNEQPVMISINRKNITMENKYADMTTLEMIEAICKALGCPFERGDDDVIDITFQGEDFRIHPQGDSRYVNIIRSSWAEVNLDEVDEVACLQRTINEVNTYSPIVAVYTIDNEDNTIVLHFRRFAVITPEMPALEEYFKSLLTPFFSTERDFVEEFHNMKKEMGLE